jgi:hypothetical protein
VIWVGSRFSEHIVLHKKLERQSTQPETIAPSCGRSRTPQSGMGEQQGDAGDRSGGKRADQHGLDEWD